MTQKKRKEGDVKLGSTEPSARDLARLDSIRKGPLKEMIECFDQSSSPAEFKSGIWKWTAHDLLDDPPVPFRSLSNMVPDHDFEDLFSHTDYDVDHIGEKHYSNGTTTSGCRALRAMYGSGGHYSGHTGGSLSVYPSARAWDREAKALVTAQKKADEAEAEADRDREVRAEEAMERFERKQAAERERAQQCMLSLVGYAATAAHADLKLLAKHAMYRRSGSSESARIGYSDEIPTQEQLRAAVWARLHGKNSMACEMDWKLYETSEKGLKSVGSVDIAGFSMEGAPRMPILLLDVRQVWALDHRYRNPSKPKVDLASDLKKLRGSAYGLHSRPQCPDLVGILVFGFASYRHDLDDEIRKVFPSLEQYGLSRITLVRCDQSGVFYRKIPTWQVPVETSDGTEMADMFMEIDLLVLDGE